MNTAAAQAAPPTRPANTKQRDTGYGRARLRLGITGVGLWVTVSAALLATDATANLRQQLPDQPTTDLVLIALLLLAYICVQLPLDWLGGYAVPKRFGRQSQSAFAYAASLARGVAVHAAVLSASAAILYLGGSVGGVGGAFLASLLWIVALTACRAPLARLAAALKPTGPTLSTTSPQTHLLASSDVGFTGGITGLLAPKRNLAPAAWRDALAPEQFDLALARRQAVASNHAWRKGRLGAIVFTAVGLLLALTLAGPSNAGTSTGVVNTALWFTLWSFLGLLTLPTLSRAAIYHTDQQLISQDTDPQALQQLTQQLDQYQDGEPTRSPWIERIFHPIPSVTNRSHTPASARAGYWDIARTAIFMSLGACNLLTRSVHCNVGRPALWVWLPTD